MKISPSRHLTSGPGLAFMNIWSKLSLIWWTSPSTSAVR
jgi:hypothetical protein